jgi:hypothetical protein
MAALGSVARAGGESRGDLGAAPDGRAVYERACASCHGLDGRGADPTRLGFDVPMPDFTDCAFTSREPSKDWMGIADRGGPIKAFDEMMPAFGQALSEDEVSAAIVHVKSFCPDPAWPRGELNLPRALLTEKAFIENEALLIMSSTLEGPLELTGKFIYEQRFGVRNQFEVVVPFGARELGQDETGAPGGGRWAEGVADVGFGLKRVLFHSLAAGSIFSVAGEIFLPTGDEADGYGKGTFVFEPILLFGQQLGALGFIQLQSGLELPVDTQRAEREGYGRVAIGRSFRGSRFGRTWSPMFEVAAAGELGDPAGWGWDCVPQMQVTISKRQHVRANLGLRLPMTEIDARPTQVMAYLLWDWYDGGLFEGY